MVKRKARSHVATSVVLIGLAAALIEPGRFARADDEDLLQEITVTATKIGGTLDKTPAAITVLGAEAQIQNVADLQYAVPNLSIGEQFGVNRTFIRGIGLTDIELGADSSVAFSLNGAPIARPSAQLGTFFDIDHIEVLRGPQSTLYGGNATGGAVNLVTRQPTEDTQGYIDVGTGNFGLVTADGAIGGALIPNTLLFRVAGTIQTHEGYGTNLYTGDQVNNQRYSAYRASLKWLASDELAVTLYADYTREQDRDYALNYFGPTTVNPLPGQLFGGKTIFQVNPTNPWDTYDNTDPSNDRIGRSVAAHVEWTRDDLKLQSTSAYREFYRANIQDLDSTSFDGWGNLLYIEDSKTFSQEFLGTIKEDRWNLLTGVDYFHEYLYGQTTDFLTNINQLIPTAPATGGLYDERGSMGDDAYGIFIEGTYNITDRLSATAGARYSHENKHEPTASYTFTPYGITDLAVPQRATWDAVTPKFTVDYTLVDGTLLYGTAERGFKSGVISIGSPNPPANPEYVWNYEIGTKSHLFDNHLRVAASAFYYDYKDLQVSQVLQLSTITVNAAKSRIRGVELELDGKVNEALGVDFYATYLDAKFLEFLTEEADRSQLGILNLAGNYLPNSPKYTFNLSPNYRVPVGQQGSVQFRAVAAYTSEVFFEGFNNDDARQGGHANYNASARYQTGDHGGWSVELWGRNLSDQAIKANSIVASVLWGFPQVGSLAPPRTYGVTLGYSF